MTAIKGGQGRSADEVADVGSVSSWIYLALAILIAVAVAVSSAPGPPTPGASSFQVSGDAGSPGAASTCCRLRGGSPLEGE